VKLNYKIKYSNSQKISVGVTPRKYHVPTKCWLQGARGWWQQAPVGRSCCPPALLILLVGRVRAVLVTQSTREKGCSSNGSHRILSIMEFLCSKGSFVVFVAPVYK